MVRSEIKEFKELKKFKKKKKRIDTCSLTFVISSYNTKGIYSGS